MLTGSWFAGVKRWHRYEPLISAALLPSRTCYAGQMHAFALARLGSQSALETLHTYLDYYLRRPDLDYDQRWVMAHLLHLSSAMGVEVPPSLWSDYAAWATARGFASDPPVEKAAALWELADWLDSDGR